jgi:hypothetical protein
MSRERPVGRDLFFNTEAYDIKAKKKKKKKTAGDIRNSKREKSFNEHSTL